MVRDAPLALLTMRVVKTRAALLAMRNARPALILRSGLLAASRRMSSGAAVYHGMMRQWGLMVRDAPLALLTMRVGKTRAALLTMRNARRSKNYSSR
jgi:hypothetical protein